MDVDVPCQVGLSFACANEFPSDEVEASDCNSCTGEVDDRVDVVQRLWDVVLVVGDDPLDGGAHYVPTAAGEEDVANECLDLFHSLALQLVSEEEASEGCHEAVRRWREGDEEDGEFRGGYKPLSSL